MQSIFGLGKDEGVGYDDVFRERARALDGVSCSRGHNGGSPNQKERAVSPVQKGGHTASVGRSRISLSSGLSRRVLLLVAHVHQTVGLGAESTHRLSNSVRAYALPSLSKEVKVKRAGCMDRRM